MEPQRKSTDGSNKTAPSASTLLNSYSKIFLAFCSSGSDSVSYCKFLYHVKFRRAALLLYSQALMPWQRYRGHAISLPWAVLCVVNFLIACSSGPIDRRKHETMKRRRIHHILRHRTTSMQVRGRKSAPVDRHLHDQKQPRTRHESCPTPQFLFNDEALSCRKVVKMF